MKFSWFHHTDCSTEQAEELVKRFKARGVRLSCLNQDYVTWTVSAFLPTFNNTPARRTVAGETGCGGECEDISVTCHGRVLAGITGTVDARISVLMASRIASCGRQCHSKRPANIHTAAPLKTALNVTCPIGARSWITCKGCIRRFNQGGFWLDDCQELWIIVRRKCLGR